MKKEKNNEQLLATFEDSDYQQELRVDPLTTMDRISEELAQIEETQAQRKKAEEEKKLEEQQNAKSERAPASEQVESHDRRFENEQREYRDYQEYRRLQAKYERKAHSIPNQHNYQREP